MEIEVTEFELFLLREGHRTMREQVKISKARMKAAAAAAELQDVCEAAVLQDMCEVAEERQDVCEAAPELQETLQ